MANSYKLDFKIGVKTDQDELKSLEKNLKQAVIEGEKIGTATSESLNKAVASAKQILDVLKNSQTDFGTMSMSKFNKGLKQSKVDVQSLKKELVQLGPGGAASFNTFQRKLLETDVQIGKTNKTLDNLAKSFKNTVSWGISSTIFNSLTNSLAGAYGYVQDLDRSLNDVRIVTSKTADEMTRFAREANTAAKNLGTSTTAFTDAALIYYQQGDSDAVAKAKAEVTLKTANVTGQSASEVSEQLTAVWNGYQVSAEQSELYIDKLAAVAASTASDLEELSTGMGKVASAANIMGVDIDQLNATLATVVSVTRQAPESVGTAFKTIYARMGDIKAGLDSETTLGSYTSKMKELGFSVLDGNGNLRDMGDVIEEVGGKWEHLTREQQINLSQTMAGKRQYNNLLSLFDNWDMYTDAINTSINATGTLDEQQGIYMESVEASIAELRTSWEGLYDTIFDEDLVKGFNGLLSQVVQSFDKIAGSMGGGLGTLAGVGAMGTNLFSNQLGTMYSDRKENQFKRHKNAIDLANREETLKRGIEIEDGMTNEQLAEAENAKIQLEYNGRLMRVQESLSEESYKELVTEQKTLGVLKEQNELLKLRAQELGTQGGSLDIIGEDGKINVEAGKERIGDYEKDIRKNKDLISSTETLENNIKLVENKDDPKADKKKVKKAEEELEAGKFKNIKEAKKQLNTNKKLIKQDEEQIALLGDKIEATKALIAMEKKRSGVATELANSEAILSERYDILERAKGNIDHFKTMAGAASGLAGTYSLLSSSVSILADENASFGEKLTQLGMVAAMTLPGIIGGFKNFADGLKSMQLVKKASMDVDQAEAAVEANKTAVTVANTAAENANTAAKAKNNATTAGGIALDTAENAADATGVALSVADTAAENANTAAKGKNIIVTGAKVIADGVAAIATGALTIAMKIGKTAIDAYNTAMLANPAMAIAMIITTVLVSGIALLTSGMKAATEAQKEANEESIKAQNEKQNEIDKNLELIDSYLDLYDAYEKGTASKEDMAKAAANLIEYTDDEATRVDILAGNYDALAEAMRNARLEELNSKKTSLNTEKGANESDLVIAAKEGDGRETAGGGYKMGGVGGLKENSEIQDIMGKHLGDDYNYGTGQVTIDNLDGENLLDLYDRLSAARDEMADNKLTGTDDYKYIQEWLGKMQEEADAFRATLEDIENTDITLAFETADFSGAESEEELKQKIEDYKTEVKDTLGLEGTELELHVNTALQGEKDNEFVSDYLDNEENKYKIGSLGGPSGTVKIDGKDQTAYEAAQKELQEKADKAQRDADKHKDKSKLTWGDALSTGAATVVGGAGAGIATGAIIAADNGMHALEADRMAKEAEDLQEQIDLNQKKLAAEEEYQRRKKEIIEGKTQETEGKEAEINDEELNNLLSMDSNQLDALVGAELEGQDFATSEEAAKAYADALQKIGESSEFTADRLGDLTTADKELLEELDVTADTYERYVDNLVDTNEVLEENEDIVKDVALAQIKSEKGLKKLVDGFDDWKDVLDGADKDSIEYMEAVSEMGSAISDAFGVDNVSTEFIEKNLVDIEKLVNGDKEAFRSLKETLSEDIVTNLDIKGASDAEIETTRSKLMELVNSFDGKDIVVGTSLETGDYVDSLNDMLAAGQITQAQANDILNSIGYTPKFDTKKERRTTTRTMTDNRTGEQWTVTEDYFVDVPIINADETIYTAPPANNVNIPKRSSGGSGGSGGGGGSSSSEPEKIEKTTDDEKDIYHDVNIRLEQVATSLERAADASEKLFGTDLIKNYNEQFTLLERNIELFTEKLGIAEKEQAKLKKELSAEGVTFNADGTIGNYFSIFDQKLAELNAIEDRYNSMSASSQERYKDTYEEAKEKYEELMEKIQEYDDLNADFIPGLEDERQDAIDEQYELQQETFKREIEVRLDMAGAIKDWNEFEAEVLKGFGDEDILGLAQYKLKDFSAFFNADGDGSIEVAAKYAKNVQKELEKMQAGKESIIYGNNQAQALEDLKEYYKEVMDQMSDFKDMYEDIQESFLDMLDQASDKFGEQIDEYSTITDLLQHDMDLITMLYGEESYGMLSEYYDKQEENNNKQLDFHKQQVAFWKEIMNSEEEGSDAWNAAKDNWMSSIRDLNSAIQSSIENLQDKYLNTINEIFEKLNNEMTGGLGLEHINEEWELMNQNAEKYLDDVNSIYETQSLANKYQKSIDEMSSVTTQQKLNDLMKEELKSLQEKDKLSQYDIDRANLKYEIALKQIALEEAQQNKNNMRLKRDSQGNYSYQYVADEDKISGLQQDMSDLYNQLYNMDKDAYQGNLDELYGVWAEFQEKMVEAAQINDPEKRAERELMLQQQYGELINSIVADNEDIKANINESAMSHLFDLYNQNADNYGLMSQEQKDILDQFINAETGMQNSAYNNLFGLYDKNLENFNQMTEGQKDILMSSLVPAWNSAYQSMADKIAGEGGFEEVVKDALEEIKNATNDYQTGLKDLETAAGEAFDRLEDGTNDVITATGDLLENNDELINSYKEQVEQVGAVVGELDKLINQYEAAGKAAAEAAKEAREYWLALENKNADEYEDEILEAAPKSEASKETSKPAEPSKPSLARGSRVDVKSGTRWYANSYGGGPSGYARGGVISYTSNNPYGYNIEGLGWIRKTDIVGYDTGGYTGAWGQNGKMAFLHQKELVLNAEDTKNMLDTVSIVRNLMGGIGSGLGSFSSSGLSKAFGGKELLDQNVMINAEFPNVRDARDIENALNNLVNQAAQQINK